MKTSVFFRLLWIDHFDFPDSKKLLHRIYVYLSIYPPVSPYARTRTRDALLSLSDRPTSREKQSVCMVGTNWSVCLFGGLEASAVSFLTLVARMFQASQTLLYW